MNQNELNRKIERYERVYDANTMCGAKDGMSIHSYVFGDGNGMDGIWGVCGNGQEFTEILDEFEIIRNVESYIKDDDGFSEEYKVDILTDLHSSIDFIKAKHDKIFEGINESMARTYH